MKNSQPDIVIVGAGHNTLTAAAYLARCGQSVLVLERNGFVGGGAVSRPLTLPGFIHDSHATNVNLLQRHPILAKDELGLKSQFGLKFSFPTVSYMAIFEDGQTLAVHVSLDATCEEIARHSPRDAEAYRKLMGMAAGLGPVMGLAMFRPPVSLGALMGMMERLPGGSEYLRLMFMSGSELVLELFEHPRVRLLFLRWAGEMSISPFDKGSALTLLSLLGGAHAAPGGVAIGGTQSLSDAMVRSIESDGGEIRVNAKVTKIINERGVARSVLLDSGEVITARKAVIAAIHPHRLGDMVDGLDPGLVERARKARVSTYSGISVQFALNERPDWISGPQAHSCMSINLIDNASLEEFEDSFIELKRGRMPRYFTVYANVHTNHDPSRAPVGKHTLNVWKWAPYELDQLGAAGWDNVQEVIANGIVDNLQRYIRNLSRDNILARHVATPLDHLRHTPSFQGGDVVGLDMSTGQLFGMRPTAELSQYNVPGAEGLYLCGPFMHPGGGLMGGGRPVAIRIMEQLKINYDKVIRS